jgi:hypothetical protein
LGKKKVESVNKSKWNPEFIAWSEDAGKDRFRRSIYQHDFCLYPNNSKLLTARSRLDTRNVSLYAFNYNHGKPNRDQSIETQKEAYSRFIENRNSRAKTASTERLNVASCLVWNEKINRNPSNIETVAPLAPLPVQNDN